MDKWERQQEEHIAFLVEQASTRNGADLTIVITDAISHSSVFAFADLLCVPNIHQLAGTGSSIYGDLLTIFAFGTWNEYKRRLPPLNPDHVLKLKQLTVLSLAETRKELPYETLLQELDITNVRDLEDFLITNCIYVGIVKGKLNQLRRCFEIQFAASRDFGPNRMGSITQMVGNWCSTVDRTLASIEECIKWYESMNKQRKESKKRALPPVDEVDSPGPGPSVGELRRSKRKRIQFRT